VAALRYWGIGFSIEDHAIAKQIDQGIARVVFGRLASDLGCIDKIERWLQRKGHQTSYVEILSDRVGRHYEQLMRDILNEEEMIARRAKLYEDFAEKTDLRVRLADVPRRHGAGVQVTKVLNRERVEQKLASIRRIGEVIILSPTALARAVTDPAILEPEEQKQLLGCLPNTIINSVELAVALKKIFIRAIESAGKDSRGPVAFVPDEVRVLVRRYVKYAAIRTTAELRERERIEALAP